MLRSSKEKGFGGKEEGISDEKYDMAKGSTRSRQWSGFRNPRIVRVSRSFGGKDRHSKVCTIRGLRDRRIRLSVPTAIQLYDLQDKLKLGQPSKVIDWLLDVTKLDIDKLPPLQIPTGLSPFHQHMLFPQYHHNSSTLPPPPPPPFAFDMKDSSTMHIRDVVNQTTMIEKSKSKGKWIDGGNDQEVEEDYNEQIMMNNCNAYNYNTCDHDHDHQHSCGVFPSQIEAQTSSSSCSSLVFTPYASYITNPFESHIHFLSSNSHTLSNPFIPSSLHPFASQNLKPFPPNFNLKQLLHADNNNDGGSGKDGAASGSS